VAEIEIHHEHGHEADPFGKRIGVLVGIIGILLAAVTIASHREHTAAVIHKTEANDQWSFYQAKKIREHVLDVGAEVVGVLGKSSAGAKDAVAKMQAERDRYAKETDGIKQDAEALESESVRSEARALRFDLGEGLLELGLVLCSLYFLSRKRSFPAFGLAAAILGAVLGGSGFLI
jgi:uncharacterized protein DUF4337